VTLAPGARLESALPVGHEAGLYVFEGTADVDAQTKVVAGQLAVWADGPEPIAIANTAGTPLEAMVLGGAPAEGPLVFHGPFVMNSVEQVRAAEVAFRTGRMGSLTED
jgi:redox-sensitive bicupin YhaK (pirin superfamily)